MENLVVFNMCFNPCLWDAVFVQKIILNVLENSNRATTEQRTKPNFPRTFVVKRFFELREYCETKIIQVVSPHQGSRRITLRNFSRPQK